MITTLILFASFALFLTGMQLSAFFSGSETGFYRVSRLQLTLLQQQGDDAARQLVDFVRHPERFVGTTMVGNNVANYLTTVAIGLFVAEASGHLGPAGGTEITTTLILAPIVFVFGELIPKSLYYRSPLSLLRHRSSTFRFFYYLFLPLSFPLTLIARVISRFAGQERPSVDTMFGRTRMFGLIASGERDGILTQVQRRMADNLMHSGSQTLAGLMEPPDRIPRVKHSAGLKTVLAVAAATGSAWVFVQREGQEVTGAVRVSTLMLSQLSSAAILEPLPQFSKETHPLVALSELFRQHAQFGIVRNDGIIVGVIRRNVLSNQLLMARKAPATPKTEWEL
ncbi:MAG: CNNM domain-containing protein [Fuerstiella sp.]|nr:CNNM domain-containing protein [Fuerstiella sp.]